MEKFVYRMEKSGWDARTGGYDALERCADPLTLKQVRARVARLPSTTDWLWNISKYRIDKNACGGRELISYINAEEFDGDVPDYDRKPFKLGFGNGDPRTRMDLLCDFFKLLGGLLWACSQPPTAKSWSCSQQSGTGTRSASAITSSP